MTNNLITLPNVNKDHETIITKSIILSQQLKNIRDQLHKKLRKYSST